MTRSLVVGGSGYIGRELVRQLAARGDEVTVLGRSPQPEGMPGRWLQGDITSSDSIAAVLGGLDPEIIYHVASLPGDTGDPLQMVTVNLLGLTHLLVYARDAGVKRFVLSSSISAYEWYPATKFAPPDYMPVDEEHPARPKDMYASTKLLQEVLAFTFYHQYGLPVSALRLTAVVGPGGRGGGRGWREFAEMLAEGESVQIPHFSLDELCHYVDLRDVARMHIAVGEHPNAAGEFFNCCGPGPTRGSEFAAILESIIPGIRVETGFPWSMAQGGEIEFDMSKAKRLIDFEPRYSMRETILSIKAWVDAGGLEEDRAEGDSAYSSGVQD
ncbi:MAG: NAD(P)-dependent oxidoreductase [Caldilineaceae bacterium]|nr:NAD(P)-dependent oxidoreductase [Caldilineaceae bacterium]MDE0430710.1 NAD(P)-dependent oxidoreductase [Caldilineaceae bacterium]